MAAPSPLDKRVPRNPRYEGVESRLDTGLTVGKVKVLSTKQFLKRQDEIFLRLSAPQLHELFSEYELDDLQEGVESVSGGLPGSPSEGGPVIMTHAENATPRYERPYLILDVREAHEFNEAHIFQARSFPASLLRQDKMSSELYAFRNKAGTLIVLYDEDDRLGHAARAATLLVDRGFTNVFVLTKGLVEFADRFPSYVEGDPPERQVPSTARSTASHRSGRVGSSSASVYSHASSTRTPRKAESSSGRGGKSSPSSPPYSARSQHSARSFASPGSVRSGGVGTGRDAPSSARSRVTPGASPAARRARLGRSPVINEVDDAASDLSSMSVAESVISRAASRKGRATYYK